MELFDKDGRKVYLYYLYEYEASYYFYSYEQVSEESLQSAIDKYVEAYRQWRKKDEELYDKLGDASEGNPDPMPDWDTYIEDLGLKRMFFDNSCFLDLYR